MAIRIDLQKYEGCAAALTRLAHDLARDRGFSSQAIDRISQAMGRAGYCHLLDVIEQTFPGLEFQFVHDPRTQTRPRSPSSSKGSVTHRARSIPSSCLLLA